MLDAAFSSLARLIARFWPAIIAVFTVAALLAGYAARNIPFDISLIELLDPDLPAVLSYNELRQGLGELDPLLVAIEADDPALLSSAADELAGRLATLDAVDSVDYVHPGPDGALQHYLSRDGKLLVLFAFGNGPADEYAFASRLVEQGRQACAAQEQAAPGLRCRLGGGPLLVVEKQRTLEHYTLITTLLAMLAEIVIMIVAFRAWNAPLLTALPLSMGMTFTLAAAYLLYGRLCLLTAPFLPVLAGLGIDYGVHLISRYDEERGKGAAPVAAVELALRTAGRGILPGALITAAAFFTLALASLRGFAEAGVLGGLGILITFGTTLLVLPALLLLRERFGRSRPVMYRESTLLARIGRLSEHRPRALLAIWAVVLAAAAFGAYQARYDTDILGHEVQGEAVQLYRELDQRLDFGLNFGVAQAPTLAQAWRMAERLERAPGVGRVVAPPALLALGDMPGTEGARRRFIAADGSYLVYAFASGRNWDEDTIINLSAALRAASDRATGPAVLAAEIWSAMRSDARRMLLAAAAVIWLLLLLDFHSLRYSLLAMLPVAAGSLLMVGAMSLAGIAFSFVNIMALPLVLGIGIDNGVHILHRRLAGEPGGLASVLGHTGRAVVVTSLTNMCGFGALLISAHRGLAGLGLVLALGVAACMLTTLALLPAALAVGGGVRK